jgi:hypothetical protein
MFGIWGFRAALIFAVSGCLCAGIGLWRLSHASWKIWPSGGKGSRPQTSQAIIANAWHIAIPAKGRHYLPWAMLLINDLEHGAVLEPTRLSWQQERDAPTRKGVYLDVSDSPDASLRLANGERRGSISVSESTSGLVLDPRRKSDADSLISFQSTIETSAWSGESRLRVDGLIGQPPNQLCHALWEGCPGTREPAP